MNKTKPWTEQEINQLTELRGQGKSLAEITKAMGRTREAIRSKLRGMNLPKAEKKMPVKHDVELEAPAFGYLPLKVIDGSDWVRFGLVSDTHLCCKEERLDALHSQYDLFAKEGITRVLHSGNIIDGYAAKINGDSVFETSIDGQTQYFIDNYPVRKGITTYYITANDHDYAWMGGKEGFNGGAYLQYVAKDQRRNDLHYLGHVEADIAIKTKAKKNTIIRVTHGGGGCPYARSYVAQKTVESYEGGEKPAILLIGHHHVANYLNERNVHVVNMPGFQAQTIFGRTKRLRYEIGGAIMEFKVNIDDGSVTRFKIEFNMFFDRGYYRKYLKSDARLLKGNLVLKA